MHITCVMIYTIRNDNTLKCHHYLKLTIVWSTKFNDLAGI